MESIQEIMRHARETLTPMYGEREASAMVDEMMLRIKGWDRVQTVIRANDPASEFIIDRVKDTVSRLMEGEPLQYIFGKAHFYGMDFTVTPDTLIPRPETAQLVDMIVDRYSGKPDLRVLDLGTGSGCIAIALARNLPFPAEVIGIDISTSALKLAQDNAQQLRTKVTFLNADMLSQESVNAVLSGKFDIIVSNPPYIARHEEAGIEKHVLEHEPHSALFVPDNNPLLFYKSIISIAETYLADNGTLFLEINPLFVNQLVSLLRSHGFSNIDVEKDMQKADRFIIAS